MVPVQNGHMNYLYGDSSPSQLTANFLEFLRDAIDFSVAALKADDLIGDGRERRAELKAEADAQTQHLAGFIQVVSESIENADKGLADSPTARASGRLLDSVIDTHSATLRAVRQQLTDDLAVIDEEEASARESCVKALEVLLLPHDPPEATSVLTVAMSDAGHYSASSTHSAAFGLEWTFDHAILEKSLWALPVHVSRLAPHLQIHAPQLSGWISKEVKVKPLKLERHLVTQLVDDGSKLSVTLRLEGANTGFDLTVEPTSGTVRAVRVGPAEDASVGDFTPTDEDLAPLVDLASKLRAAALELPRQALQGAVTAGADFRAQPSFLEFVRSLIAMMTPIAEEISKRSLSVTRDELILRRLLADDRREEIFASKATLSAKYAALRGPLRAFFAPLGLDPVNTDGDPPASIVKPADTLALPDEPPPVRTELPPSSPPAALPPPTKPRTLPPPMPPPRAEVSRSQPAPAMRPLSQAPPSPQPASAVKTFGSRLKPAPLPPARPPPKRLPAPAAETEQPVAEPIQAAPAAEAEHITIEVTDEEDVPLSDLGDDGAGDEPANGAVEAAPESESRPSLSVRNEDFVAVLKMIAGLARSGRVDEAHVEYGQLFADASFGTLKPEEQRQVLRLMVIPKVKPASSDAVVEAHRIAISRIEHLTATLSEAVDYELLGVAQVTLGNLEAAREAFANALAMERARMPQSELVGTLMKRMSEI